jgi:hypothetical protein
MARSNVTLLEPREKPIQAGMEVFTPRGFGKVVCRCEGDPYWAGFVVVELDDDQGRAPMRAADLQVVDRVGS